MEDKILLRKTDLARQLGVSAPTILKWTRLGIFQPAEERIGGNMYDLHECRKRFEIIQELKTAKKTLADIKKALDEKFKP